MAREKAASVKANSYVPYGSKVIGGGYIGQNSDANANKAND